MDEIAKMFGLTKRTCDNCGGKGTVLIRGGVNDGLVSCHVCRGEGWIYKPRIIHQRRAE